MDTSGAFDCDYPDPLPEDPLHRTIISCPTNLGQDHSYTINIADIPYETADFYAVAVRVTGPRLSGGYAGCQTPFIPGIVCVGLVPASYEGSVTGGDYVERVTGSPLDNSYSTPDRPGGSAKTNWPDPGVFTVSAMLLNPAPTWPVPDAFGNEYGKILFTEAQLPTSISTTISRFSTRLAMHGVFVVRIDSFVYGESEPEAPFYSSIIGSA